MPAGIGCKSLSRTPFTGRAIGRGKGAIFALNYEVTFLAAFGGSPRPDRGRREDVPLLSALSADYADRSSHVFVSQPMVGRAGSGPSPGHALDRRIDAVARGARAA